METLSKTSPHHLIMAPPKSSQRGSLAEKPVALLTSYWGRRKDKGPRQKKAGPWRGMNVQV